jgi:hypothetical protein
VVPWSIAEEIPLGYRNLESVVSDYAGFLDEPGMTETLSPESHTFLFLTEFSIDLEVFSTIGIDSFEEFLFF